MPPIPSEAPGHGPAVNSQQSLPPNQRSPNVFSQGSLIRPLAFQFRQKGDRQGGRLLRVEGEDIEIAGRIPLDATVKPRGRPEDTQSVWQ